MQTAQTRLLALALIEIRMLLADYLGSDVDAPMSVRVATHMAYARDNDAGAAYSNAGFRLDCATQKIAVTDQILGVSDGVVLLSRFDVEDTINPDDAPPRLLPLTEIAPLKAVLPTEN